ncbi:hypothetical protein [Streptomyces hiroshimensis]|uniref:Uncharacterized protein n=1 Tax=Streptomyces hiroshimensis TaxID=66424 RepID=A0ABQ2YHE0_9ACTN|nr:hypothetical protein [Streptomyces hiroshimensis]GGX82146.1 hypothetical protein GCM10010324_29670 [Streptomyces hiroshimensis]
MTDRSLRALGLDGPPAELPLTYPGRPVEEPALLTGGELLPLRPGPGPLDGWRVVTGMEGAEPGLDLFLDRMHAARVRSRHPVLAVGSNASPAQLHHKLTRRGTGATVPMAPVEVHGIGVACSAHIGRHGYVAAAPYADPAARRTLVAGWLDAAQLAVVDETEFNYRRLWVPGERFPMTLPSGSPLGGAYLYVSLHGVLADPAGGGPRAGGGDQGGLLSELLAASQALRELLGPGPEQWVARARADEAVRAEGRAVFRREGWVLPDGLPLGDQPSDPSRPSHQALPTPRS